MKKYYRYRKQVDYSNEVDSKKSKYSVTKEQLPEVIDKFYNLHIRYWTYLAKQYSTEDYTMEDVIQDCYINLFRYCHENMTVNPFIPEGKAKILNYIKSCIVSQLFKIRADKPFISLDEVYSIYEPMDGSNQSQEFLFKNIDPAFNFYEEGSSKAIEDETYKLEIKHKIYKLPHRFKFDEISKFVDDILDDGSDLWFCHKYRYTRKISKFITASDLEVCYGWAFHKSKLLLKNIRDDIGSILFDSENSLFKNVNLSSFVEIFNGAVSKRKYIVYRNNLPVLRNLKEVKDYRIHFTPYSIYLPIIDSFKNYLTIDEYKELNIHNGSKIRKDLVEAFLANVYDGAYIPIGIKGVYDQINDKFKIITISVDSNEVLDYWEIVRPRKERNVSKVRTEFKIFHGDLDKTLKDLNL